MTAIKHIKGTLTAAHPELINGRIHDTILRAAVNYQLGLIIKDVPRDGIIKIDSITPAFGRRNAALQFIDCLTAVLNEKGVPELELTGSLMVIVTTDTEPVIFRVTVENGAVFSEEVSLVWGTKTENPYQPYPFSKAKPLTTTKPRGKECS